MARDKEKKREYNREYFAAHREDLLAKGRDRSKEWYERNREHRLETQRRRREGHPESLKRYEEGRREQQREYQREYRQKKNAEINERRRKAYAENAAMHRERARQYKLAHPEVGKKWREQHKEELLEAGRRHRLEHPEYYKRYYLEHLDQALAHASKRRARKSGAAGFHTAQEIRDLLELQGRKCAICRTSLKHTGFHRDHVTPLSKGGSDWIENIALLCPPCNLTKHAKDPDKFAREHGRLFI